MYIHIYTVLVIILKSDLFEDTGYKILSALYQHVLQYHFVIIFQIFFIFIFNSMNNTHCWFFAFRDITGED